MADQGNGGTIHICKVCSNVKDPRSALWFFTLLPVGSTKEDADSFQHWKYRGPRERIHDTCRKELEQKAANSGKIVVFWPSPELQQIWREQKEQRRKEKDNFQSDLADILGPSSSTTSTVAEIAVVETKAPVSADQIENSPFGKLKGFFG